MSKVQIDPFNAYVGRRIRIARLSNGESQAVLGKALNLVSQQIQKYERGINEISVRKIRTIAQRYHLPVRFFFEGYTEYQSEDIDGMLRMRSSLNFLQLYHQLDDRGKKAAFHFLSAVASKATVYYGS